METASSNVKKIGKLRRGWELTKSSWRVVRLDKRLLLLPLMGFVVTCLGMYLLFSVYMTLVFGTLSIMRDGRAEVFHGHLILIPFIVLAVLGFFLVFTLSSLFTGALVYGANTRFHGGKPTVLGSLKGVSKQFVPLAKFAIVSGSIGMIVQIAAERIPFAGKLVAWLGGAAWSVATMFSIPIIVLSDQPVGPIDAVKQSSSMLKKVWGEGLLVQFGVGTIAGLSVLGYVALVILASIGLTNVHLPRDVSGPLFLAAVLGGLLLILVYGTLTTIMRTALYYYAKTGEAPELFNKELLHASMTVKKARRIFA